MRAPGIVPGALFFGYRIMRTDGIIFILCTHKKILLQAILYYLTLPLLYLISVLPFPVLYGLSNGIFFLLYHVFGYRKTVVFTNLRHSFPEKTEQEIQSIGRQYYKHLCDLFLETFKTLTISPKAMLKHCRLHPEAQQLLDNFAAEKKSIIIVMGHHGNWEWGGNTFSLSCRQPLYVIYHPLENPYFNKLIIKMRTRFGTKLIPMNDTFRQMAKNKGIVSATAFIADQTPHPENAYWTQFLHQDTPVFWGTERISRKMNLPVVYMHIRRKKRGFYEMMVEMLEENPKLTEEGEITERFTRLLEKKIKAEPETWLWSHRRWKHKKPVAQ